jgi:ech hydrogenase subunit D
MSEVQNTTLIEPGQLLEKVSDLKKDGYRLVQIGCTKTEGFEINYTFDKDYDFQNLRLQIPEETEIMSISGSYFQSFLYENEMRELFGVKINNINVDYQGHLYKLAVKTPFNPDNTDK